MIFFLLIAAETIFPISTGFEIEVVATGSLDLSKAKNRISSYYIAITKNEHRRKDYYKQKIEKYNFFQI